MKKNLIFIGWINVYEDHVSSVFPTYRYAREVRDTFKGCGYVFTKRAYYELKKAKPDESKTP